MIDGNISMEEDTELRDLVVQTLENNGVLAKLRAELRASVFLALEEQEAVVNPEPLLNKTVKQYLANSDGKLLFSLVREFLEYFGLDYTISVYDSETYFGKEYNYTGRNKLSEKLGIDTTEPLLSEILKNSINGAFNSTQKSEAGDSRLNKTNETSTHFSNTTFEVSVPKIVHNESASFSNDNDSSEKAESITDTSPDIPINVTITDKKKSPKSYPNSVSDTSSCELQSKLLREKATCFESIQESEVSEGTANNNVKSSKVSFNPSNQNITTNFTSQETKVDNETNLVNKSEQLIKFDESLMCETTVNQNEEAASKQKSTDLQITNNAQNIKRIDAENNFAKTVYFEEIIVDGNKQKVGAVKKSESLLGELPPLAPKSNSIFGDLPPLNGKKTNINDLKELMDIGLVGDATDNYEEDFVSSASGSANEQSPAKGRDIESPDRIPTKLQKKTKQQEKSHSARTDDISEEIDEIEEVFSNASCLEDTSGDNGVSNFAMGMGITADYKDEV